MLTEKVALHLRALQTFTDELGKERKVGEEWLGKFASIRFLTCEVTHKDKETHIPDVYEQVVAQVQLTSLSNREYCCIRDPVDESKEWLFHLLTLRYYSTAWTKKVDCWRSKLLFTTRRNVGNKSTKRNRLSLTI